MALQPNGSFSGEATYNTQNMDLPGKSDDRKLFVGALTRGTTDNDLIKYFCKYGEIESVAVKKDHTTGISRGFAFVAFSNPESVDNVLAVSSHYINGRKADPKRVYGKQQQGKIFVGGLTPNITQKDIRDYFSKYGTIIDIQTPFDRIKQRSKGYCFVTFDSMHAVDDLLKGGCGKYVHYIAGKQVDVNRALSKPETQPVEDHGRGVNGDQVWLATSGVGYGSFGGACSSTEGYYAPPPAAFSFPPPSAGFSTPENGSGSFGGGYVSQEVGYECSGASYMPGAGVANYLGPPLFAYAKCGVHKAFNGYGMENVEVYDAGAKPRIGPCQRHQPY